tara:strand:+ start:410 stop:733 length:324 start_codon:yes stop_codon:yes gene_type:complete
MENLTMRELEERQAAERAELRLQLDEKELKRNKINTKGQIEHLMINARWLKQTAEDILNSEGKVCPNHSEILQQRVDGVKYRINQIYNLKHDAKQLRKQIKNRKENK